MAVNSFNAQNPPVTTKGDVFTFSTIPTRLGVGANDTVLTADSSTTTGLKWASVSANKNMTLVSSGTVSGSTFTVSSLSNYDDLLIIFKDVTWPTASSLLRFRINGVSTSSYRYVMGKWRMLNGNSYYLSTEYILGTSVETYDSNNRENGTDIAIRLENCKSSTGITTFKLDWSYLYTSGATNWNVYEIDTGAFIETATVSSFSLVNAGGYSMSGDYWVYGG